MRAAHALVGIAAGALLAMAAAAPAGAHHAFAAEFDASAPVELTGTVVRMEWVNPHTWIHIDVPQDDGTCAALDDRGWAADLAPAAGLHPGLAARGHRELFVEGFPREGRDAEGERT